MSSLGSPTVGGAGAPEKRGPSHPKGKKIEVPEMSSPASQKCGRPKVSRNQRTLAALAAAAAAITTAAAGAALTLSDEGAPKKRGLAAHGGAGGKPLP
jgi:hypothetical protein